MLAAYFKGFQLIWMREWTLARANKVDWFNALIFFVMCISILPITLDVQQLDLAHIAPSMIWIVTLLSFMLSADLWFKLDFEQGYLHQWLISPFPVFLLVIAKVFAHWFFVGGGILLATPFVAVTMNLSISEVGLILATLILGTLVMAFVCALGAALTLSLRQAGVLLVIISMPLNVPVIIYGTGLLNQFDQGLSLSGGFLILASIVCATITFMPFAIATALRISIE